MIQVDPNNNTMGFYNSATVVSGTPNMVMNSTTVSITNLTTSGTPPKTPKPQGSAFRKEVVVDMRGEAADCLQFIFM